MYQGFKKVNRKRWVNGHPQKSNIKNPARGAVERRTGLNEPKNESELYVLTELLKLVLRMSAEDRLKALWYTKGLADAREEEK